MAYGSEFLPFSLRLRYKGAVKPVTYPMRLAMRHISAAALLLLSAALHAQAPAAAPPPARTGIDAVLGSARSSGDDFLPPDQAFRFDALPEGTDRVRLNWEITDGYYLYRARIKVKTVSTSAQLGAPEFPPGQVKTDEYFGKQEVYHHELVVVVPARGPRRPRGTATWRMDPSSCRSRPACVIRAQLNWSSTPCDPP